jgi:threonine aldolase
VEGPAGVTRAVELVRGCAERKVKVHAIGPVSIRCVTHKDVDADDIGRTVEAVREITTRW